MAITSWQSAILALVLPLSLQAAGAPKSVHPEYVRLPDGRSLAIYRGEGATGGVPLLAIAGGPGSDHRYLRVGDAFARIERQRQVVYYDQRGSGKSSPAGDDASIEQFVEDIEAIRKHLAVEVLDVYGHSFGSYLAMAYVTRHPDRVRSIVFASSTATRLADTPAVMDRMFPERFAQWAEQRRSLPSRFPARDISLFQSMEFVEPEVFRAYMGEVADHMYNIELNNVLRMKVDKVDYAASLRQVRAPTLVLHGRWDAITSPKAAWDIHRAIAGSTLHIVEGAGHLPYLEKADEYVAVVLKHLAAVDARKP